MVTSLYDQAMAASKKRRMESIQRAQTGLAEVNGLMDFLDEMSALQSPVGSSGGGGSKSNGLYSSGGAKYDAASVRNLAEGRGPSSGPIPGLVSYHWRDPVDNQRFNLTTEKGTKKQFKGFLTALARTGYDVDSLGSYSYRNARGSSRLSEHAYGRAIDVNPDANPMGDTLVTDMPKNINQIAALYDLVWGGSWKSKKDAMHFSTTGW